MINWTAAQIHLGVKPDGQFGTISYTALLAHIAGHQSPLMPGIARSLAANAAAYKVDQVPKRLADFLGQCSVESMGFTRMREIWGPTPDQLAYDKRGNPLGNNPGEGFKMRGAGLIEVTGRDWFEKIGRALKIDLAGNPDLANDPNIATLISLEWWAMNNMNVVSDMQDTLAVSRGVNRGNPNSTRMPLAYGERVEATKRAMEILA